MTSLADLNRRQGLVVELPNAMSLEQYTGRLSEIYEDLKTVPHGVDAASSFEDIVGHVIKLCLFRSLTNVQDQVRDVDNTTRRDWIGSNRASTGFWQVMRDRYGATQIVFECKNYPVLNASDFHQAAYYMNDACGRLIFLVYRGEEKKKYYRHIKNVHNNDGGLIVLLNDKDLAVFIRQSMNGKVKDDHLQALYDDIVRSM